MANNIQGFVMIGAQAIVFSITNLRTLKTIERGRYPVAIGDDFYAEHEILMPSIKFLKTMAYRLLMYLQVPVGPKLIMPSLCVISFIRELAGSLKLPHYQKKPFFVPKRSW